MNNEREAKVVITADTKQYNENIKTAHAETEKLNKGLAGVTEKMDGLLKRTGKKMVLIGSGTLASLAAASTATTLLNKQMSGLEATAVNAGKSMERSMGEITQSIRDLSREVPIARGQLIGLTTTIGDSGIRNPRQVMDMTREFTALGAATGEDPNALAANTIALSRQMGIVNRSNLNLQRANDATTVLSARSGVSANQILGFSQNLAPTASIAGLSENEVKGISTAFARAGQDGSRSANIFNKLANDITYMQQSGSPDLDKYAAVLGTTREQIDKMSPVDILDRLTTQVARDGKNGQDTLRYLGFDSIRAQKALQGLAGEGGVKRWIAEANRASASPENETQQAADVAFSGLSDSMEVMRNKFTDLTTTVGTPMMNILKRLTDAFNSLLTIVEPIADAFAKVLGVLGSLGGAGLVAGGLALKSWAGISTPAIAKRLVSSTPVQSMRFGFAHGRFDAAGMARPDDAMTRSLAQPAGANGVGAVNRGLYGMMTGLGRMAGPGTAQGGAGGLGGFFRTGTNMALMGAGAMVNNPGGLLSMKAIEDHYNKVRNPNGLGRIGDQRQPGMFRNFWGAFTKGGTQQILGDKPKTPADIKAEKRAKMSPSERFLDRMFGKIRAKITKILSWLETAWKKATQTMVAGISAATKAVSTAFQAASVATYEFVKAMATATGNQTRAAAASTAIAGSMAGFANLGKKLDQGFDDAANTTVTKAKKAKDAAAASPATAAAAANAKAAGAEARARVANVRQIAATTPVLTMLRTQLGNTTKSFAKLVVATTRASASMAAIGVGAAARMGVKGVGAGIKGIAGMAGGLIGMGPVAGAAVLGGGALAYGAYKTAQAEDKAYDALNEFNETIPASTSGLKAYNDALGVSTQALIGWAGRFEDTAETAEEATDMDRAKYNADNQEGYIDPKVEKADAQALMNLIGTMGNASVKNMEQMSADIVKKFGHNTETSRRLLDAIAQTGTGRDFQEVDYGSAIPDTFNIATGYEGVGWWNNFEAKIGWDDSVYFGENSPLLANAAMVSMAAAQNASNKKEDFWSLDPEVDKEMSARIDLTESTKAISGAFKNLSSEADSQTEGLGQMWGNILDSVGYDGDAEATAQARAVVFSEAQRLGVDTESPEFIEFMKNQDLANPTTFSRQRMESLAAGGFSEEDQVWEFFLKPMMLATGNLPEGMDMETFNSLSNLEEFEAKATSRETAVAAQEMKELGTIASTYGNTELDTQLSQVADGMSELMRTDGDTAGVIQDAINNREDPVKAIKARDAAIGMLEGIEGATMSTADQITMLTTLESKNPKAAEIFQAAKAKIIEQEQRSLQGANQAVQFASVQERFSEATQNLQIGNTTPEMIQQAEDSKKALEDTYASLYVMIKNYEKGRAREEEDYNRNRAYQEEDYNRSVMHSKEDFYRARRHQTADFHRNMERQEEAYQIRLQRMIDDYAKTMYDPYQRMMGQGARSGNSMLFNLDHQEEILREQIESIEKLKERGLSDEAIEMLDLLNPNKAQQANLWGNGQGITDEEIQKLNKAIGRRTELSEEFVTHDNNTQFQRMEEDRARQIRHAVEDFARGMRRSQRQFQRTMRRSYEAYLRGIARADFQRELSLNRAKDDLLGFAEDTAKSVDKQAEYVMGKLKQMNTGVADELLRLMEKGVNDLVNYNIPDESGMPRGTRTAPGSGGDGATVILPPSHPDHPDYVPPKRASGGIARREQLAIIGDGGPEAVIPLNSFGAEFMGEMLKSMYTNNKNMPMGESAGAMQVYNNSTNFNGEIHIRANNPNEIAEQLKHRKRMDALRGGKGTTVFS